MNHAKKMLLIDPDTLGRIQQRAENPVNNTISSLDQEMERILTLKHLTDDEKWLKYKQVLARFLHFTNESRNPIAIPIVSVNSNVKENKDIQNELTGKQNISEEEEEAQVKDFIKIQTLKSVPKKSQNITELLYDTLNNSDIIKWNVLGSVSVHGEKLFGSSIIDLISDVVRNRRDSSPPGWETFAGVLAELNIPQEYILNVKRREFIQQLHSKASTPITPKIHSAKKNKTNRYHPWERFKF